MLTTPNEVFHKLGISRVDDLASASHRHASRTFSPWFNKQLRELANLESDVTILRPLFDAAIETRLQHQEHMKKTQIHNYIIGDDIYEVIATLISHQKASIKLTTPSPARPSPLSTSPPNAVGLNSAGDASTIHVRHGAKSVKPASSSHGTSDRHLPSHPFLSASSVSI